MKAEIICNHFTPDVLSALTGIQITPEVMQVLQNDVLRSYRIDIETESTVRADLGRTQEQMSLFLQGTAQYATAMAPIIQLQPNAKAGILEIYAAFARQYKLGKSAEDALDQMIEAGKQPEEPKPSPEEQKMQLEQQKAQMQGQMDQAKGEREMQKMQMELQIKQQLAQVEMQLKQADLELKRELAQLEMQKMQMEIGFKQQSMAQDMQMKREAADVDLETRKATAATDVKLSIWKAKQNAKAKSKPQAA
jgi:hypothetical protein